MNIIVVKPQSLRLLLKLFEFLFLLQSFFTIVLYFLNAYFILEHIKFLSEWAYVFV